jgi:hypothetical protein
VDKLPPKQAEAIAVRVVNAMQKAADPGALRYLANRLAALAGRMHKGQATQLSAEAAQVIIQAMQRTTDPSTLGQMAAG